MTIAQSILPYGRPVIDEDDVAAVAAIVRTGALTDGPAVEAFEHALAATTGAAEAVVCSSGTTALHLVALGLGLKAGDQVVVPSLTFLATANCARFVGADVIFADSDPETGLMTPENFEAALARADRNRVKAVIPVHLNGQTCDMRGIKEVAGRSGVAVFEDSCHTLGGTYQGNEAVSVGNHKDSVASCFSFHPIKAIATGEGGAITTNDHKLAATMRLLRGHGMEDEPQYPALKEFALAADGSPNPWYYEMRQLGWNFRASDLHCALGLSQLKKLPAYIRRRAELVARYDVALRPLAPTIRLLRRVGGNPAWHLYVVHIDFAAIGMDRAAFMRGLAAEGIGSAVKYLPVHLQPYYQDLYGRQHLTGAETYYSRCLSLPLFPAMTDGDVDHVVEAVRKVAGL